MVGKGAPVSGSHASGVKRLGKNFQDQLILLLKRSMSYRLKGFSMMLISNFKNFCTRFVCRHQVSVEKCSYLIVTFVELSHMSLAGGFLGCFVHFVLVSQVSL